MSPPLRFVLFASAAAGITACILVGDNLEGQSCLADKDCPLDYYCGAVADGGKVCQVNYPFEQDGGSDGGVLDSGPDRIYDYCNDAKPLLQQFCVSNCHGGIPALDTSQQPFELDQYTVTDGGKGAFDMRDRIKIRTWDLQTMPPIGISAPTQRQRQILAFWDQTGATYGDGGGACAPPLSFGVVIQPIFDNEGCSGCHAGMAGADAGNLNLTTGHSWQSLLGVPNGPPIACNCGTGYRVVPGDAGASMIWLKLSNMQPVTCGASMPRGQTPLAISKPAEFQQITTWIEQGALDN